MATAASPTAAADDGDNGEPSPTFRSASEEGKSFDRLTETGAEGGLFRACMKAIRTAHFRSNRVRAVLVVAGVFTDVKIYREVMACFYALTAELERKLLLEKEKKSSDPLCEKILALGYRFTQPYEDDLAFLYGPQDWKEQVEMVVQSHAAVSAYRDKIRGMTESAELAGAVFVLWGGLVIGGGAAAMPRVRALYGVEATHVYEQVTGPGRDERKRAFVETWDSLATSDPNDDGGDALLFGAIVRSSQECMQGNNNVLTSLTRNPWWVSYLIYATGALLAVGAMFYLKSWEQE